MQNKKAAFFDIDGTLWNFKSEIPESTIEAIRRLQEKGNLAFLCSGRSRGYIRDPKLLAMNFDGIVSGCGTMIEFQDQIIFDYEIDPKQMEWTINTVRKYHFRPILEGKNYLYLDDSEFGDDFYGKKVIRDLGERRRTIADEWGKWETCKLSCATDPETQEACFEELSPYYDFIVHTSTVVEIIPKGFHKGTGIEKVCELTGLKLENTYAFGDSANDLGMLKTVGTSIAMGDGQDVAREAADFITLPLMDGGIYHACEHFGLI